MRREGPRFGYLTAKVCLQHSVSANSKCASRERAKQEAQQMNILIENIGHHWDDGRPAPVECSRNADCNWMGRLTVHANVVRISSLR
jgi:hypothetical protein